jgi:hypothetical protein
VRQPRQIRLASLLLYSAAMPVWAYLIWTLGNSRFGHSGIIGGSVALIAATAALFILFRKTKNALALSAFLAGLLLMGSLVFATVGSEP